MSLSVIDLTHQLKKQVADAYCLTGEETVLQHQAAALLINAWRTQTPALLKHTFWIEGSDDWQKAHAALQQQGLFQEPVLLELHLAPKTATPALKAFLADYANAALAPKLLIHAATLKTPLKIPVVECKPLKGGALLQWIDAQLKAATLTYEKDVPRYLADCHENNALAVLHCIQHLSLLQIPLTIQTLTTIFEESAIFPLYTLMDACLAGQAARIQRILQQLKLTQTEPLIILWWFSKTIRQLLHLHHAKTQGVAWKDACAQQKIWASQQSAYARAISHCSVKRLQTLQHTCATLDRTLKSMPCPWIWDHFEQLAFAFCSPLTAHRS